MKYLSVCSGVEAATVAWHPLGWTPVAFSEIEKFPSQVLSHHYPNVPNMGDMTKYKEWDLGSIDLLVGGTPCQSFSVAGLRKGLDDPRGNLALVYCGILDHYRPQWFVWENVPGVLSSNGGRDFGSFLGALAQLGYGFAYRVLDAQYWGVAQRRKRVFVVGYLGDWRPAAAVLFESKSLSRDTKPSREKGEGVANTLTKSPSSHSGANPARGEGNCILQPVPYDLHQVTAPVNKQSREAGDPCHTLAKQNAHNAGIVQPISIHPHCIGRGPEAGPQGKEYLLDGSAYCMDSRGKPQAVIQPMTFPSVLSNQTVSTENLSCTLEAKNQTAVMQPVGVDMYNVAFSGDVAVPLTKRADATGTGPTVMQSMAVRRLTPVECERLQGFPDNYTNIKENCPDGPRYKAMGNSMAVPVMRWIGERIALYSESR